MADRSPATRAIITAFNDRYELCGPFDDNWQELCLAAALRSASTQLTNAKAIDKLRNIAAELEGATRDPLKPNDLSHLSEEEFQALAPQGYHGV